MALDLGSLNEAQRRAVTTAETSTLIVAGPGTGKTHTLSFRAAYLLAQDCSPPPSLLALTFTHKAAQEMSARVEKLLGATSRGSHLWIGTFHAWGLSLLREEGHQIGLGPDLHILSPGEQLEVVKEVLSEQMPHESLQRASTWARRFSAHKQRLLSAHTDLPRVNSDLEDLLQCYEARLQELKVIDFDDLIVKPLVLLREVPTTRDTYRSAYQHLMVDEYQDVNEAQYQLLRELTGPQATLWVIGDADQAIYAFRGAEAAHFLHFQKSTPGVSTIRLETNYRSSRSILAGAQAVIAHNQHRIPHLLSSTRRDDAPIFLRHAPDEKAEARYVAKKIETLVGGLHMESSRGEAGSFGFSDIVVLYRLHQLGRVIADTFASAGIPYQVVGGISAAPDSWSQPILGFLRSIINPHDDLSLCTLLQLWDIRLDFPSLRRLMTAATHETVSLYSFLQGPRAQEYLNTPQSKAVHRVLACLRELQEESLKLNLAQLLRRIITHLKGKHVPEEDHLAELFSLAQSHSQGPAQEQLSRFWEHVVLAKEGEAYNPQAEAVTLMTIHAAKGLEFPVVFMIGLESGVLPCTEWGDGPPDVEEERRLLYVAMTRAKQRLYLSCAQRRYLFGESRTHAPSPFIAEIPPELIEQSEERPHPSSSGKPKAKQRSFFP
jgi:DNA helicase II / ATP-dependent DNA helicase PcrA